MANTQRVEGHMPTNLFKPLKVVRGPEGYQLHDAHGMVCDGMTGNHAQAVLTACNNIERIEKVNEALVEALKDARYALYGDGPGNPKIDAALSLAKEPA